MSTRNPMNERYTSEEKRGVSRRSAASAKPKTKAAATVYVKPAGKTPQEKKAARRETHRQEREREKKYDKPDTPRFKKLRRLWWVLLAVAVAALALSWLTRGIIPDPVSYVLISVSYAGIIAAFVLEFTKIRKERRRYAEEMERKTKENRAAEKKAKAEQRAQKAEAAEKFAAAKEAEAVRKKGFFSRFGAKKDAATDGDGAMSEDSAASKGAGSVKAGQ